MKIKRTLLSVISSASLFLLMHTSAYATPPTLNLMTWGTVNAIGVDSNGVATVSFNNPQGSDPSSEGTCYLGVFFSLVDNAPHPTNTPTTTLNKHPGAEAILSLLLTAKTSDQAVMVQYYSGSNGDAQSCLLHAVILAPAFPSSS